MVPVPVVVVPVVLSLQHGHRKMKQPETMFIQSRCFTTVHQWLWQLDRRPHPPAAQSQSRQRERAQNVYDMICKRYGRKWAVFTGRVTHTHLLDDSTTLIKGNDWLGGFVVQVQALLDGFLVVIGAATGLTTLHKPFDHGLCFSVDVQQQAGFANLWCKAKVC